MFWRGVWGYLPANIVAGVAGFGAIFAFTRLLPPEAMGWYALAVTLTNLLHTLVFTWAEAAMARFEPAETSARGRADHRATIYGLLAISWLIFPVAGLGVLLWPAPEGLKVAVAAGLGAVMARTLLQMAQVRMRAAGEVGLAAGLDVVCTAGSLVLGLVFAWAGLQGAAPLAGMALATAACAAWALPRELKLLRGGRFRAERVGGYARYGVPLSLSLMLTLALGAVDRLLLATFMDGAAVGVYHAGYSLSSRTLDVIFIWLGMAGGPAAVAAFEARGLPGLQVAAREQARLMALLTLPATVGLMLVARPLCDVMLGAEFREGATRVMPWIALAALLGGFTTHYLHQGFTIARRTGRLGAAMAIAAVSNVGLNVLLIPRYGLDGAVWATAASYALGAVASWALLRGPAAMPLPWRDLGRCGAACAAMAIVVAALPALGGVAELLLKAGLGALTYALAAYALDAAGARAMGDRLLAQRRQRLA
jgi:O-antigen/teichoic acid export membrane protein